MPPLSAPYRAAKVRRPPQGRVFPAPEGPAVLARALPKVARARGEMRDPAPSRLRYRWHRIWLTPLYRRLFRLGLPVACVALALGLWFGQADRRAQVMAWVDAGRAALAARPEFQVTGLSVTGASPETEAAIAASLDMIYPISSLGLDLATLRARLTALDAVARADLRVNAEGALEVNIAERLPVLVWRSDAGLELLDETGHRVAPIITRVERPDLPLIAGPGAESAVADALAILAAAQPLRERMRGLVRMGERRWDVVLDRGQRILLPEKGAIAALERVIALDQAEDLLARDVIAVDLRHGARPTLRLAAPAMATRLGLDQTATLASATSRKGRP